jgi:hypothetical protein
LSNVAPGIYSGIAFTGTGTSVNNKEHNNYIEITPQNTANALNLKFSTLLPITILSGKPTDMHLLFYFHEIVFSCPYELRPLNSCHFMHQWDTRQSRISSLVGGIGNPLRNILCIYQFQYSIKDPFL